MLAFGVPGPPELLIIALVLVLLFGATRLPKLARGIAESIKEFRSASRDLTEAGRDVERELKNVTDEVEKT